MINIHSDFYVEIAYYGGTFHLEYDDAADLVEAIRAEPDREAEFMTLAVQQYEARAIEEAAEAIINAREFCSHERTAAHNAMADLGIKPLRRLVASALVEADRQWSECQRAAGVTAPISPEERATITRTLENAS